MKLFDDDGQLIDVARRAVDAGVILDIGRGAGSFSFTTAEAALAAGIRPHAISTDIHQMSVAGPMFDLPTCLVEVSRSGTRGSRCGGDGDRGAGAHSALRGPSTLRVGALADIALFRLHEGASPLYDNTGVMRTGRQLLRYVETIVGGQMLERRAASPHAIWAEHWDSGGANARVSMRVGGKGTYARTDVRLWRCRVCVAKRLNHQRSALLSRSDKKSIPLPLMPTNDS
jgi:dihydroorotase